MAVAAYDRHAGLRAPLFGADDMDDATARVSHGEILDAVPRRVADQRLELRARFDIGHSGGPGGLSFGRDIMIRQRQRPLGPADPPPRLLERGEGLRRRHFVQQVQIDIEQGFTIVLGNGVRVPYLVVERARAGHRFGACTAPGFSKDVTLSLLPAEQILTAAIYLGF